MRLGRFARLVPLAALLLPLAIPSAASADHCGADTTITPSSGPPGATFVFRTNLGAPSDLRVYRNDTLVKQAFLEDDRPVRYDIETAAGDLGNWRARAEVRGRTECAAEGTFTVLGTPDTSTASERSSSPGSWLLIMVASAVVAFGLALRQLARSASQSPRNGT